MNNRLPAPEVASSSTEEKEVTTPPNVRAYLDDFLAEFRVWLDRLAGDQSASEEHGASRRRRRAAAKMSRDPFDIGNLVLPEKIRPSRSFTYRGGAAHRRSQCWSRELSSDGFFEVMVGPQERDTFNNLVLVQYRNQQGRTRRLTIGRVGVLTPSEARHIATERLRQVTTGVDPSADRHSARHPLTVGELCDS